ncbi:MAG: ADOP family duplicated permease [Acidobacteriota bacterium]
MDRLREWAWRALGFLRPSQRERELQEEMQFHLEMETERNVERGMSRAEAERHARMRLGGTAQVTDAYREQRSLPGAEQLLLDMRHAVRGLRRTPGYTAMAIAVLALGIGANTAVWSVADAVLFRPLAFFEPERLVNVTLSSPEGSSYHFDYGSFRFLEGLDLPFSSIGCVDTVSGVNVSTDDSAFYARAARVSSAYLDVFGRAPALGRSFATDDVGAARVLLSHAVHQRLGGSDAILGETVRFGGEPHVVIGVMPDGFEGVPRAELWLLFEPDFRGDGTNHQILARLDDRVEKNAADAALASLSGEFYRRYEQDAGERQLGVVGLRQQLSAYRRADVLLLLGAVGLLLLVACANCASLLLARLSSRSRELAVRAALGGGRRRILQLLAAESLVLAAVGGTLGVLIAVLALRLFETVAPADVLAWSVRLDARVLAMCGLLSLLSGALFSLGPALGSGRLRLTDALHDGSRGSSGGRGGLLRRSLVVLQITVSYALLVGAGLLAQTLIGLQSVDLGFEPEGVWTAEMSLQGGEMNEGDAVRTLARDGLERLALLGGVRAVALGSNLPGKRGLNLPVTVPEREQGRERDSINYGYVTPDFFGALGVRSVRGRTLGPDDDSGAPRVAVVNEAFVRNFFPSGDVLGRTVEPLPLGPEHSVVPRTIVGVVADFKTRRLDEEPPPSLFVPLAQASNETLVTTHRFFPANWVLSTDGELDRGALERAALDVSPDHPFSRVRPIRDLLGAATSTERFQAVLLFSFSFLALAMAAAGLFGVVSFSVSRRQREIGVRMALGASASRVLAGVLAEGFLMGAIGVALGLAAAFGLTQFLRNMIFGVSARDPSTLLVAAALLLLVAILASLQPALRATRIDPATSFRAD